MEQRDDILEHRCWRLTKFHASAETAEQVRAVLLRAAEQCERARTSRDVETMRDALVSALGEPRSLRACQAALAETWPADAVARYERIVDTAVRAHDGAVQALVLDLSRALARDTKEHAENLGLLGLRNRALQTLRGAADGQSETWHAVLSHFALTQTERIQRELTRQEVLGTVRLGDTWVPITHHNLDSLLLHPVTEVRRAAARARRLSADGGRALYAVIKHTRVQALHELAKLRGFDSPFAEYLARSGLEPDTLDAHDAAAGRLLALVQRYAEHVRASLAQEELEECDLSLASPPPSCDLSLQRLLALLDRSIGSYDEAYPATLRESFVEETALTLASATRTRAYYVIGSSHGGPPLVHAPYERNILGFMATAHELGHACHLTVAVRVGGPLAVHDLSMAFSEIFSLTFEILALVRARAESTGEERTFWCRALLAQFLHFARTLWLQARFDGAVIASPGADVGELEALRQSQLRQVTPETVRIHEDLSWLRNLYQETYPFCGYAYRAAFFVAYRLAIEPRPLRAFAVAGSQMTVAEACRTWLGIDPARSSDLEPVWRFVEGIMEELEGAGEERSQAAVEKLGGL